MNPLSEALASYNKEATYVASASESVDENRFYGWIGLAGVLLFPMDGRADVGSGRSASYHGEHKRDVASWTFRMLLYDCRDFNLSAEQIGKLEELAADYARATSTQIGLRWSWRKWM